MIQRLKRKYYFNSRHTARNLLSHEILLTLIDTYTFRVIIYICFGHKEMSQISVSLKNMFQPLDHFEIDVWHGLSAAGVHWRQTP